MAGVVILGAGGHGRDFAAIARARGQDAIFLDDDQGRGWMPLGYHAKAGYGSRYIGVNEPEVKRKINEVHGPIIGDPLVHPSAAVDVTSELGWSCVVGAATQIGEECRLGDHAHIGAACTVTRTTIGDYATIGPGCDLAGDVTIGEGAFLGVGVVVKNLVTIGAWSRVGAGSVVVDDVPDGATVKGVPAR